MFYVYIACLKHIHTDHSNKIINLNLYITYLSELILNETGFRNTDITFPSLMKRPPFWLTRSIAGVLSIALFRRF